MKLVLVGNTCVGKTCIARMATTGSFSEDTSPTLGASYVSKLVHLGNNEVHIQIWDTAGQERYRGMTPMYFRGAHAAVASYSITDEDSFTQLDSWILSVRENSGTDTMLFIVGNKCDLEDQRTVTTERGQAKATEAEAVFFEVSAKTGDRIDELFVVIAKSFLEKAKASDPLKRRESVSLEMRRDVESESRCC
jgi:Ras-related protein Rab-5C